jgi:anthranilate phosphoribosyltransferase
MVKLMQPLGQRGLLVTSYTHPEYLASMTDTLKLTQTNALLLRGTEGEPVADIRRTPAMDQIFKGQVTRVQEMQAGSLQSVPELPAIDASSTARWIERVANGQLATPAAIDAQAQHIVNLAGLLD